MQGITRKISEYHILFWLQPLPLGEKKMRKAAEILRPVRLNIPFNSVKLC